MLHSFDWFLEWKYKHHCLFFQQITHQLLIFSKIWPVSKTLLIKVGNNRKLCFVWINYLILLLVKSNFLRFHNLAIHAGNTWILLSFKYRAVKCVHLNINGLKFLTPQLISSSCQLVPFPAACSSWNNLKKMNDANSIFSYLLKNYVYFLIWNIICIHLVNLPETKV